MKFYIILCLFGLSLSQECVEQLQQSVEENIDFPGSDVLQILSPDVNHCQLACTQHHLCQFFTFVRPTRTGDTRLYRCYLKYTPSGEPTTKTPLDHVTSGFSFKACVPKPSFCLSKLYTDVDFTGMDYRGLFTADPAECQRACTNDPGCQFFSFLTGTFPMEQYRFKCHLKYSKVSLPPVIKEQEGAISGFSQKLLPSGKENTSDPPPAPGCQTKIFSGTNIPGYDIEQTSAVSADHCLFLCSTHPTCTYFSYNTSDSNKKMRCFLKTNAEDMRTVAAEEVHSGLPVRFCQPSNAWLDAEYEGLDFLGEDSRHFFLADSKACKQSCLEDPYCQFYTYATDAFHLEQYRRNCFLKQIITIPLPPNVVTKSSVVSGFSLKNCS